MTVKEHYDKHLGNFYSWMAGDFDLKSKEFRQFLEEQAILPCSTKTALDLGAGHGIQSVALAHLGFAVTAVDFNRQLLDELKINTADLPVNIVEDDIRSVRKYASLKPELIVCWGDTLTHLSSEADIERFIDANYEILAVGGKLMLSFREYTFKLKGTSRFIPVKSDNGRILTCFLEYGEDFVTVTDLLHERTATAWQQKVSSYRKVRIQKEKVIDILERKSMNIMYNKTQGSMVCIIAAKPQVK